MKKEENAVVGSMKRGFTLVELLVVVAILGILGTIAIQNVTEHLKTANVTAAQASVKSISEAVTSFYIKNHKLPTDLNKLVEGSDDDPPILEGGEGALIDPWDTEYKLEIKGKRFVVISAGPDTEFGTEDDIRSDKSSKSKK